jgi:hypothetical protein
MQKNTVHVSSGARGSVIGWGYATSRKVAGSSPDVNDFFPYLPNPSSRTLAL